MSGAERVLGIVLFERLSGEVAATLRDVGCPYADGSGVMWAARASLRPVDVDLAARAVRGAIASVLLEPTARFAVLDLRCGGADALSERPLGGLAAVPERLLDNPITLVDWLSTLHATRGVHASLRTYLACSDPDEILPFLPYHPKGPDVALGGLMVRDATVVVAVEAVLHDGVASGRGLVLPGGVVVPLA